MTTPCYECHTAHDTTSMRQWEYWRGIYVWLCLTCSARVTTIQDWEKHP